MPALKIFTDSIAIAANEFLQFKRNRSAVLISLVLIPLFFTVSQGAGRGSAGSSYSQTANIPMVFVDNDRTMASVRLWQTLSGSQDFHRLTQASDEQTAIAGLGLKQYYAVIVIPKGFQNILVGSISNSTQARLILYTDDAEPGLTSEVTGTLTNYVQNFNPSIEVQPIVSELQLVRGRVGGVEIIRRGTSFPGFNIGLTVILAIVQIFAVFYEIAGGLSREREEGTFARLILSPMNISSMILGKTAFDLVLSTIRTFTVLGLGIVLYRGHPNTEIGTILVLSLLIALMTMGLGFLVSALKVGLRAVVILEFFLVLTLYAFSGLLIDKELLVGGAAVIANSLPFSYAFDAMRRTILVGRPLLSLTTDLTVMVASIVGLYVFSYVLLLTFRERLAT
ncbi:MAG: ABC transporter permease [Candidatus Bathyarchaeia archaeon]|jgi:ABC-type multidrug transport system permease subunit